MENIKLDQGIIINIVRDNDPLDPRKEFDDSLGKLWCFHSRYNLGDEKPNHVTAENCISYLWTEYGTDKEKREIVLSHLKQQKNLDEKKYLVYKYGNDFDYWILEEELTHPDYEYPSSIVCLPVYMYDHGGVTINTDGFSCPWDSGKIGIIFTDYEKLKECGMHKYSDEHIEKCLKSEVQIYDAYLTGDVYGFIVKHETDKSIFDSCYGYYSETECISEAKEIAEYYIKELKTAYVGAGI